MSDPEWTLHCADFAVEHVKAQTGRDIWKELGGRPSTPREAADMLKRLHVRSYKNAVSKVLGKPVDPKLAMRGDLVMVDNALGICRGDLVECMDRMNPMSRAECAWKVTGTPKRAAPSSSSRRKAAPAAKSPSRRRRPAKKRSSEGPH